MALTRKHKELIATLKTRADDLKAMLADENIDEAKYQEIQAAKAEIENLKAQIWDEMEDVDAYMNDPASRTKDVVGLTESGESYVRKEKGDDGRYITRLLKEYGPGIFGEKNGYHKRASETIQDPAYKKAFFEYLRKGPAMSAWAYKNLEEGLDPQGGYLAPAEIINRIVQREPTPTRLAGLVENIVTWTDENPASDTVAQVSDASIFGSVRIPNYTAMIEGILTNNMVEDAVFDLPNWVSNKFDETVTLLKDNMILNGTGIEQPTGIITSGVNASQLGDGQVVIYTAKTAGTISPDDIRGMAADVPEQYDENCRFVMNKTVVYKAIRLLKDAQNRYLFGMGYQDSGLAVGRERTLDGYPYVFSGFMPPPAGVALAAGQYPLLFGDLRGYTFVNRIGFAIQVLREVAARRNQIILLGRVRFGGQVLEGWRMRLLSI